MRDVVSRGTGSSIRSRFGVRGDVAGKTGTTQGNADGWFILIQPQLVAGAWVGFNDSRVTLRSDYWGQGAHSALPIVGDFFQRARKIEAGRQPRQVRDRAATGLDCRANRQVARVVRASVWRVAGEDRGAGCRAQYDASCACCAYCGVCPGIGSRCIGVNVQSGRRRGC